MEFTFTVPNSVEQTIKTQAQISKRTYPAWVTVASYSLIVISVIILTFLLSLIFRAIAFRYFGIDAGFIATLVALIIAYTLTVRFVSVVSNSFFLKFALFEIDFEYTSQFGINENGLIIDEGDRHTRIAWSAIGGVFETKDYLGFYCRGLVYTIPFDRIIGSERADLFSACKAWQSAAQGHKTAKAFI